MGVSRANSRPGWGIQVMHTAVGMVVFQILTFLSGLIVARNLGPEGQGKFQLLMSIAAFSSIVIKLGLDEAVTYLIPKYRVRAPGKVFGLAIFSIALPCMISLAVGLIFFVSAKDLEKNIFRIDGFAYDLRYLLGVLPSLTLLLMCMAVLRGLGRSDLRAYIFYYLVGGGFLGLVTLLSSNGLALRETYVARLLSYLLGGGLGLYLVARLTARGPLELDLKELREAYKFAGLLLGVSIFQYLREQPLVDLIILSRIGTTEDVGVYSVAARLSSVVPLVANAMVIGGASTLAEIVASGNTTQQKAQYQIASNWMAVLTTFVLFGCLAVMGELFAWLGPSYKAGIPFFVVLLVGAGVTGITGFNAPMLLASEYARYELLLSAIGVGAMAVFEILLGWAYGPIGVAVASSVVMALVSFARWYICYRVFDLKISYKSLISALIIAMIATGMFALSYRAYSLPWPSKIIVAGAVYFVVFAGLGRVAWSLGLLF